MKAMVRYHNSGGDAARLEISPVPENKERLIIDTIYISNSNQNLLKEENYEKNWYLGMRTIYGQGLPRERCLLEMFWLCPQRGGRHWIMGMVHERKDEVCPGKKNDRCGYSGGSKGLHSAPEIQRRSNPPVISFTNKYLKKVWHHNVV